MIYLDYCLQDFMFISGYVKFIGNVFLDFFFDIDIFVLSLFND